MVFTFAAQQRFVTTEPLFFSLLQFYKLKKFDPLNFRLQSHKYSFPCVSCGGDIFK